MLPLILLTSGMEAVGAAGVFVLVASIAEPAALTSIRWLGPLLQEVAQRDPDRVGLIVVTAVAVFYVVKSVIVAATEYSQALASANTATNLSVRLLAGYLRASYMFHLRRNSADMIDTTTRLAGTAYGAIVSALVHIAAEVTVLFAIVCVLLLVSPGITLVASLVLLALGGALVRAMRGYSSQLGARIDELSAASMRQQTQALSAIDEILVLGRTDHFIRRFSALSKELAGVLARGNFFGALPRITVETMFICGALSVVVGLIVTGVSRERTVSLLGLFAYAGFRIIPSANRILLHVHTARVGRAGLDRIRDDLADIAAAAVADESDPDPSWRFADRIELRQVSLRYSAAGRMVLEGVDLAIRCGESVAIVGHTGSGKSSLVRLLTGLLQPVTGSVLVDSVPLRQRLSGWRSQIGYVPQEVHLVDDSLLRNVALGIADEEVDRDRVEASLRRAQLEDVVASLADGWETMVGDRGVRLSGGERQRVGIARALYHDPRVLILDEATSSLDAHTEWEILRELRNDMAGATLIAVTHRLSSVRNFERLVFFHEGAIAGVGSFDELVAEVPEFRKIALAGSDS